VRSRLSATIATVRRSKSQTKTKGARLKSLSWATLLRGGFVIRRRWKALSQKERARLASLLRESRGRPGNLSAKQRKELHVLLEKLDLKRLGSELLPLLRGGRGRCRCRRRRRS
jgi:hypothetical protein